MKSKLVFRPAFVTDHALVRYMDRVLGLDTDAIKSEMLTDDIKAAIAMGARRVKSDGVVYAIRDGRLTTLWLEGDGC